MLIVEDEFRNKCLEDDTWTVEDTRDLYVFLSSQFGRKVVCRMVLASEEKIQLAGMQNLGTQEGIHAAILFQGQGQGIDSMISSLIEILNDQEQRDSTPEYNEDEGLI